MGRGRAPCCAKVGLKKGSWTPAEDLRLMAYIQKYGHGNWRALPKQAGLLRCGKSCRLRWINYLRPDIKRGNFTKEEEDSIIKLHELLGNKWSKIAARLPGRTDNEIKNVWNTHLKKRLASQQDQTTPADKLKESPSSPSSNSSISYCNHSDDSKDVVFRDSDPGANKDSSETCNSPEEKEKKKESNEIIEIPIESNLDIWDMLEEGSSHSPTSTDNNDMNMEHFNKQVIKEPDFPIDERRETSTSSSYNSNPTCYDLGEMGSQVQENICNQLICFDVSQNKEEKNQVHLDQMPENELWKILDDDLCLFASDDVVDSMCTDDLGIQNHPTTSEEEPTMDSDNNKWISYLEKELELWGGSDGTQQGPLMEDTIEPSSIPLQELDAAMDPVTCYFQKRLPSPSVF